MDLGVPEAVLGRICIVFVCISAVLAISCKKNIINVRGSTGRQAFCSVFEGLNSGGGFLGFLLLLLLLLLLREGRVL